MKTAVEGELDNAIWRKSGRSTNGGDCVEVAELPDSELVAVRDSKDPDGPKLLFTPNEWSAFTGGIRDGEFDA